MEYYSVINNYVFKLYLNRWKNAYKVQEKEGSLSRHKMMLIVSWCVCLCKICVHIKKKLVEIKCQQCIFHGIIIFFIPPPFFFEFLHYGMVLYTTISFK